MSRPRGAFSLAVQRSFADLERPAHFRDIVAELVRVGVLTEPVAPAEVMLVRRAISDSSSRGDLVACGTCPAARRPMTLYRLRQHDEPAPTPSRRRALQAACLDELQRAFDAEWPR